MCDNVVLAFAVCRILARSLWQRAFGGGGESAVAPEFSVLCLGLRGAGKSTLLAALCGEPTDGIGPTNGFHIKTVRMDRCKLNVKEVGGSEQLRPYWKHYFAGMQALIFVVDSSCPDDELDVARDELLRTATTDELRDVPLLLLANCSDKNGARTAEQIACSWGLAERLGRDRQWTAYSTASLDSNGSRQAFSRLTAFLLPAASGTADAVAGVGGGEATLAAGRSAI